MYSLKKCVVSAFIFCSSLGFADFVISDNDANIDDLFAYWVLFQDSPDTLLLANVVTNADSMGYQTIDDTIPKFQSFTNMTQLPFGMSKARAKNPFPWIYRADASRMGSVPSLNATVIREHAVPDGDALYKSALKAFLAFGEKVSIVATGPLTALAGVLKENPELGEAIGHLVFMGGAVGDCAGNINPKVVQNFVSEESKAEWNVFWDPEAVDYIFRHTDFPITLIPLNLTNASKLTEDFMLALKKQADEGYPVSRLAFESYDLVSHWTGAKVEYYLWDVTAAVYKNRPEFFASPVDMFLSVETQGKDQGSLYEDAKGRKVSAVLEFAGAEGRDNFYKYFLQTLRH